MLERGLGEYVNRHQGYWAEFGHVSYELTEIRIVDKADIPGHFSHFNAERIAYVSYESYSTETPTKRISTGCTFFDLDGNGGWLLHNPVI